MTDHQNTNSRINHLEERIELLEQELTDRNKASSSMETLVASLFRPIRFDAIRKLSLRLSNPSNLRKPINPEIINQPKISLEGFYLGLMKRMPAVKIKRLIIKEDLKINFDKSTRFSKANIQNILDRQSSFMSDVLQEQKTKLRERLDKEYNRGWKDRRNNKRNI